MNRLIFSCSNLHQKMRQNLEIFATLLKQKGILLRQPLGLMGMGPKAIK